MGICLLIKKIKIYTLHVKKQVTTIRKYVIKIKTIQYKNVKKLIKPLVRELNDRYPSTFRSTKSARCNPLVCVTVCK